MPKHRHRDASVISGLDLAALVVAAAGGHIELLGSKLRARTLRHVGKLVAIDADVRHLVRDDQTMLSVDSGLHWQAEVIGLDPWAQLLG